MSAYKIRLDHIGSYELALECFKKMLKHSSAYKDFLTSEKTTHFLNIQAIQWEKVPLLTIDNFYSLYPLQEIIPDESKNDLFYLYKSSGHSHDKGKNKGLYWAQLKSTENRNFLALLNISKLVLNLDTKKTLFIVGFSLGSWAGGFAVAHTMMNVAISPDMNVHVFTPGTSIKEIAESIDALENQYEQIIICLCPTAISAFEDYVKNSDFKVPWKKITYFVAGEPFSESIRMERHKKYLHDDNNLTMFSVYGSADTGTLGYETLPLIKIRQFLSTHEEAAEKMGFKPGPIPNLYHSLPQENYLEVNEGELIVTKWQGLPLVKYNLEDHVDLISWNLLCLSLSKINSENADLWKNYALLNMPDVVAVYGRKHGCLFLNGNNIYEGMLLDAAQKSKTFNSLSTGNFAVWEETKAGHPILHWQIELKKNKNEPSHAKKLQLYDELIEKLEEQQPEFLEDYPKYFEPYQNTEYQLLKFHFCTEPHLQNNEKIGKGIKKKIIFKEGPL